MKRYPLTQSQMGIFAECMNEKNSMVYNLPYIAKLPDSVRMDRLKSAWESLIGRNRVFRNRFAFDENGQVYQYCDEDMEIPIILRKDTDENVRAYIEHGFQRPFDLLSGEPLVRVELIETEHGKYQLMDAHHTIADGSSVCSLINHLYLPAFYEGKEPEQEIGDFYEAAEEESQHLYSEDYEKAKAYYEDLFADVECATLSWNPSEKSSPAIRETMEISGKEIDQWCLTHRVKVHHLFRAAFVFVLGSFSRQNKVAYFTSHAGRNEKTAGTIGMFVKSVPTVDTIDEEATVLDWLHRFGQRPPVRLSAYPFTHFCADIKKEPVIGFNFMGFPSMEEAVTLEGESVPCPRHVQETTDQDLSVHILYHPDHYELRLESSETLNDRQALQTVAGAICTVIRQMTARPDALVKELTLTGETEKAALLELSRGEILPYNQQETLIDLFMRQAELHPDAKAVQDAEGWMSYRELDEVSNRLAQALIDKGVLPGEFVAVKMPRVKEFLAAVLGVMKAGAAYIPVDPEYPQERIQYIIQNSEAKQVLTPELMRQLVERAASEPVNLTSPEGLAYMIYTSGSTGKPKGTMLPHKALRAFLAWTRQLLKIGENSRHGHYSSFSFDASVVDLLCPIAFGGMVHILGDDLRKDMNEMVRYFHEQAINSITMPTQMGMALLEQFPDLPLECLLLGGEKLLPFRKTAVRVINGYGPTEFTVCSSFHVVDQEKDQDIPIGRPVPNSYSFICDETGRLLPQGMAGELCLAGSQIANGYWKREDLNKDKFSPLPEITRLTGDELPVYRTGDLARYNKDGELEFLGRIDDQVKLRGFRIELGEVETAAVQAEGVTQAVALICKVGNTKNLCLYYTAADNFKEQELREHLAAALPEYMIPAAYICMDAMPLTPNGKVDRKALPLPQLTSAAEYVEPEGFLETSVAKAIKTILQLEEPVGALDDYIALGGDSINSIRLVSVLRRDHILLSVSDIMKQKTVRKIALACRMESEQEEKEPQIEEELREAVWSDRELRNVQDDFASRGEHLERIYPLTSMQESMLLKYLTEKDSWAYRLVTIFTLDVLPTKQQLTNAVNRLLNRYEVLRSAIIYEGVSEYRQAITDRKAVVHMVDLSGEAEPEKAVLSLREEILTHDYDLQKKSLFQLTCAKRTENSCFLLVATHHIIVDGWSSSLYFGDLRKYISDEIRGIEPEQEKTVQRGAYEAVVRELRRKDLAAAANYYHELLDGYDTPAAISSWKTSADLPEASDTAEILIDKETVRKVSEVCKKEHVTLGTAVELAWGLTLGTAAGTDDVVYAKVVSGRNSTKIDTDRMVGLFINTVPVRLKISEQTTVVQALKGLMDQAVSTNDWDWCPLSVILETTPLGRNLFQSVFAFENYDSGLIESDPSDTAFSMKLFYMKGEASDALMPSVEMTEDGGVLFRIIYDRKVFRHVEMERVARLYAHLFREIGQQPECKASALPRLDEKDTEEVLRLSRGETISYDLSQTWVDLFEEQLKENENSLAVDDGEGSFSYRQLNDISLRIADTLHKQGVVADDFVAIRLPRDRKYVAAILGIHRLGAAYVPIDMAYPESRVEYMLTDCGAKAVVDEELLQNLGQDMYTGKPVPDNLAYMIYTSGSTGKPKGVMLHHRGLMNFTVATAIQNELTPEDRVASHRSFSFDAHIEDIFPVLASGASVHIMREEIRKDFDAIAGFLEYHKITGCGFTTSIGKTLLTDYSLKVRYMTVGGEALTGVTCKKVQIINEYGPTECTNDTCVYKLERGRIYPRVPVGRPMPNSWCFITDEYGNLLPKGFAGELCYAGPQVGSGYWNLPDKTAEAFMDCPFVDGMRMYRTGDMARYNEEGLIEVLGRKDGQVKLRGYRVETGEVESAALQCGKLQYAAAVIREIGGSAHLILYYCQKSGQAITEQELRKQVERSGLPEYMHPDTYVKLDEMPRLPNGKINRRELPIPEMTLKALNVQPETAMETHFLNAAREILPNMEFGVTDNLFSLGLTSLTAMKLIVRLNAMGFREKYRVADLMRFRSIRAMIRGNRRIFWKSTDTDPDKPWLIFLYGIAPVAGTLNMIDQWSSAFNIFVIEAVDAHYDILFEKNSTFTDVVDTYSLMLEQNIPKNMKIAGMIGFSWGGALAYWLCARWSKIRNERPFAICGDTYFIHMTQEGHQQPVSKSDFPENYFDLTGGVITQKEVIRKTNITIAMENTVEEKDIPDYDGTVIFLNANKDCDLNIKKRNLELLRRFAPHTQAIDFPDHTHIELFFDAALVPKYLEMMRGETNGK